MLKPTFKAAWEASQKVYSKTNPAQLVARVIGGRVADFILDTKAPWKNTCAVRMSYILTQCGMLIPNIPRQTEQGRDLRNYFYRVRDLNNFLRIHWNPPETVSYPTARGSALAGRKGIILFDIRGFSDASGHATLFDGTHCYDRCYFNEPGARYSTTNASFWELR